MKRMKMKGVLAAVVACSATGTAFSQITASHQGPMDMSSSEVSGAMTTPEERVKSVIGKTGELPVPPKNIEKVAPIRRDETQAVALAPGASQPVKRLFRGVCEGETYISIAPAMRVWHGEGSDEERLVNIIGLALLHAPGAREEHHPLGTPTRAGTACATEKALAGDEGNAGCRKFYDVCLPVAGSPFAYGVGRGDAGGYVTRTIVLLVGISKQEEQDGLGKLIQEFYSKKAGQE